MSNGEKARRLIAVLNNIAQDHDGYSYGLPLSNDRVMDDMVAAVVEVLGGEADSELSLLRRLCALKGYQLTEKQ